MADTLEHLAANAPAHPDHVPLAMIMDLDFYRPFPVLDDLQKDWGDLRTRVPQGIFWTPRNGGHWVALVGEDIKRVQTDYEYFSNTDIYIPANSGRTAPLLPLEVDPPECLPFRGMVVRKMQPQMMPPLEARAREVTIELIEGFYARGGCEFVGEFSSILPIVVFLGLMDLPAIDRQMLVPLVKYVTHGEGHERAAAMKEIEQYLTHWMEERRRNPGDDMISNIVNSTVGDRPITQMESLMTCLTLMLGGLDTVANMLSFFALFLARNPGHRKQLREHPEIIGPALEEMIRRHGVIATGRRVVKDTILRDAPLRAGDMILIPNWMYGIDSSIVSNPYEVDFARGKSPHVAFGSGVHMCPGQHLARRELKVFVQEWLRRIPDFEVAPGTTPAIESGIVGAITDLQLRWPVSP